MKWGEEWPRKHDLSSLRLLGSVGEPINPEAWMWYHGVIGGGRCPIVGHLVADGDGRDFDHAAAGSRPTKPGCATLPFFRDRAGGAERRRRGRARGDFGDQKAVAGIMRGIWGDQNRFVDTYFSKWGGKYYFPGDGARKDEDGYFWILGRVDDVVNVSAAPDWDGGAGECLRGASGSGGERSHRNPARTERAGAGVVRDGQGRLQGRR